MDSTNSVRMGVELPVDQDNMELLRRVSPFSLKIDLARLVDAGISLHKVTSGDMTDVVNAIVDMAR